ncbi:TlyA family RNA methyltransferase [Caldicellulosiruptor naganoensis]|uniref:TlyA family RNA methyltransferase n=1 Tax=Caldicellulosiruptor naganoensis TaxID=29324 RepID=A0ABY7BE34_9FIRM|nr:TlyA family RNA methyltransferase [Caldicellulosiruptor naganoensis]WAM30673.1 TlyA family RNA methyltransferase [Caldicellulosiruptor naganoensis]
MKKRADILLVEKGFAESREKAKALILSGNVYVDNQKVEKAGELIDCNAQIVVKEPLKYVSRGGFKLEKALNFFKIDVAHKIALDVGVSTGGFTDCLLQHGAKKVYCVDVGYGQLAWKLREDPRVVNFEKTNFRYFEREKIPDRIDIVVCDVSFISLTLISHKIKEFMEEGTEGILLIKPQFEAGREEVGKKGVVRSSQTHVNVIKKVVSCYFSLGLSIKGLTYSPVKGPEGNIEYLLYIKQEEFPQNILNDNEIQEIVSEAFEELANKNK